MDKSVILLTYKGKILLVHRDEIFDTQDENPWHFIVGIKEKNKSFEETIFRKVKKEINIQLSTIEFLSCLLYQNAKKYFYHAQLTDENVNNLIRSDGKIFQFYSPKELDNLKLALSTRLFLIKHKDILEKVPNN